MQAQNNDAIVVITPEQVPLTLARAGLGARALAYAIDVGILLALVLLLLFAYPLWRDLEADVFGLQTQGIVVVALLLALALLGYDVAFECLWRGQTPGKRAMGLMVLDARGQTPQLGTSLLRNALRLVDMIPLGYAVGVLVALSARGRRLGDIVADTCVVDVKRQPVSPMLVCRRFATHNTTALPDSSSDAVMWAMHTVVAAQELPAAHAAPVCRAALHRVWPQAPVTDDPRAVLAAFVVAQSKHLPTLKDAARLDDMTLELDAALDGLKRQDNDVPAWIVADEAILKASALLAHVAAPKRAVPQALCQPLSLSLLRAQLLRQPRVVWRERLRDLFAPHPWLILQQEYPLLLRAAALLVTGFFLGFVLGYIDADVARALLGSDLAHQIEGGANWTNTLANDRVASSIGIALNNVGVGVRTFIAGFLGGVLTVVALVANGLQLGLVFGYATRLGVQKTLVTFLMAHGPVELTMVCVAGAAGLVIARALSRPLALTRSAAVAKSLPSALSLLRVAVVGFVAIAFVEGFVSAGGVLPWPLALLLGIVLWAGFARWVFAPRMRVPTR